MFLGGDYSVENMALADVGVDWQVTMQLLNQTRHLVPGAGIGAVSINNG